MCFFPFFPGSYEAAVESGARKEAASRRTKEILQIRKQDSYTKAIGGSFEDDHGSIGSGGGMAGIFLVFGFFAKNKKNKPYTFLRKMKKKNQFSSFFIY